MGYSTFTEKLDLDLIHHGSPRFDREKFLPVTSNVNEVIGSKPKSGGLWTSPTNSTYGWKDWCLNHDFETDRLKESFQIRFSGRVTVIRSSSDLIKLPWKESTLFKDIGSPVDYFDNFIPYDLLVDGQGGIDAIYLTIEGLGTATSLIYSSKGRHLHGWDCESVLIINPNCCHTIPNSA